ncbi:PhzF family phenazine biosynthesis protein [filamentous cyanobacterium LEGE 11480]|uniref:PhzF family phenazine biosynthesis protein n=1 Tax=Romeriopsis navalis LEGE 11480 TaxID=2777977 RepID=A0A928VRK9_9CYAN|nr:PhzF family phenazine biosynthesis protein [Romeriopsis navalis]MBE9030869.1 PhzF family phenazine biosynthesis protein [Romeriopsis navalis LEGE 11480]
MHDSNLAQPLDFCLVDVFAQTRYTGNQLAVFTQARDLTPMQMQQIAQELNFSETTFILGEAAGGGYDVRIFTPVAELPFAGHPTLGTAYVLQRQVIGAPIETLTLNFQGGVIPVKFDYAAAASAFPERLWMRQNPPQFGAVLTPGDLAPVLGIAPTEIDPSVPIQSVSTGLPFIIVPLRSLNTLQSLQINLPLYYQLIERIEAQAIFVFCPEARSGECQFTVRMFADALGIPEDPATGSANGCFAGYLVEHRYLGCDQIDIQVSQGESIGRPSVLSLRAARCKTTKLIQIDVGGVVMLVAQGQFV